MSERNQLYRCPHCNYTSFKDHKALDRHIRLTHTRPFKCVFHFAGCQSTFATKNEWKRHVSTQHLMLHYWLCTEGVCGEKINGEHLDSAGGNAIHARGDGIPKSIPGRNGAMFNRKDLYTQHLRRIHMPPWIKRDLKFLEQQSASGHNAAEHTALRLTKLGWEEHLKARQDSALRDRAILPTYMTCPAAGCVAEFRGRYAWDQRMEHVSKHLESNDRGEFTFGGENDKTLVEWASRNGIGIIQRHDDGWVLPALLGRWNSGDGNGPIQHTHPSDSGYGSITAKILAQSLDVVRRASNAMQPSSTPSLAPVQIEPRMEEPTYSTASTFESNARKAYVSEFAEELNSALPPNLGSEEWDRLCLFLDDILQEFGTRMAYEEPDNMVCRNIMYLVHSYHSQIVTCLGHKFEDGEEDPIRQIPPGGMSVEEKIVRWQVNEYVDNNTNDRERMEPDDPTKSANNLPEDELFQWCPVADERLYLADAVQYREVLSASPAYDWLVSRIHRQSSTEVTGIDDVASTIRGLILETLGRPKHISRHCDLPVYKAVLEVDWNPLEFMRSQVHGPALGDTLPKVITLTGDLRNAQATSCMEYLNQMWPETGPILLELIQDLVTNPSAVVDRTLPDDTILSFILTEQSLQSTMIGSSYCVSELTTQLAWLAGALRASSTESLASCTPWLEVLPEKREQLRPDSDAYFGLRFKTEPPDQSGERNGACWTSMFKNPVIVKGYPIPRRAKTDTGLEISLGIIATVTNANRLVEFGGKSIIKGFSAMLVASEVVEDIVLWHHFFCPDGRYISYSDEAVSMSETSRNVSFDVVEKSRHIVGWCEEVKCFAGTAKANYDIETSELRKPHAKCAFTNVSISAGKFLTIGATCIPLMKDKPAHISYGDDYLGMLKALDDRHFVMCDVEDRRSWLVSGASAVLHILRASIRHTKNDPRMGPHCIFPEDELTEARDPYRGSLAAFHVLSDFHNLDLPLYRRPRRTQQEETRKLGVKQELSLKTTSSDVCLKDRVDDICHNLLVMIAHQENMDSENGVGFRLRSTPRRQLEGFEFMDLASGAGTLWPKVHSLHHWGSGWVDFTRAIHAVTLFGRGFGELLQPSVLQRPCGACHWHKCMPCGRDYMAVSTYELSKIIKSSGSIAERPLRIVDNIHWYTPNKAFETCKCSSKHHRLHDRVQVFMPLKLVNRALKFPAPASDIPRNGAIILGHSKSYTVGRPEDGDPHEEYPGKDDEPAEVTDLGDSSIGSSVSSIPLQPRGSDTPSSSLTATLYTHSNDQFMRLEDGVPQDAERGFCFTQDDSPMDTDNSAAETWAQIRKGKRKASISADVRRLKQWHTSTGPQDDDDDDDDQ